MNQKIIMMQILYVLGDQMGIIPKIAKDVRFCELWRKLLSLCLLFWVILKHKGLLEVSFS